MNDKTRREFFKQCFRIGRYAGIAGLGLSAVKDAQAWGILPAIMGTARSGGTSWANWDERTESGWGDSENNFIALFGGGASTNEIGQGGGLSGADLVVTQTGSIAGASGSPPKRFVDRPNDDYFSGATAAVKFLDDTVWTYIVKCNGMSATGGILELYDNAQHLICETNGRFYSVGYTTGGDASWVTSPSTPTGDIYFALWDDGSTTKWGWTVTKPTKLSDFASSDNYISRASINGVQDAPNRKAIAGSSDTTLTLVTYVYYVVISKLCLIDNAA